jgi:ethanolamine ammonia-lyase small subunit
MSPPGTLDRALLESLVREVVRTALGADEAQQAQQAQQAKRTAPAGAPEQCDDGCRPRAVPAPKPQSPAALRRAIEATPARIATGRVGTRYKTSDYITLRAEHAVALDAVKSTIPDEFAATLGLIPCRTRAQTHREFLLHPELGRRLDDDSQKRLEEQGTRGADVVVVVGDGLSALATLAQVPTLLPALTTALEAQGFRVGKPVFVRHCRIGVQDEIGVLLAAKSTIILVGERPGLGTGDSLSIYTAFRPRLGQDNAEKNCISNVRPLGFPPAEAALECARLMRRTFDAGGGGVHLVRPMRDVARRVSV